MIRDLEFPAAAESVGEARDSITQAISHAVNTKVLFDALLLTSELVTNSVRHAGLDPEQLVSLHIESTPQFLRVEVIEPRSAFIHKARSRSSDSGWGLFLMEHLSDRYGFGRGKSSSVWFEIDLKG